MKTTTFVVALACSVLLTTGCRTPQARHTKFPEGQSLADSVAKQKSAQDLNTDALKNASGSTGAGEVTGSELANAADAALTDLADIDGREKDREVFKDQTVYFEYDQAHVRPSEAAKLEQVLAALKSRGTGYDLLIEGHCDERGTEEYNRSLGERRALALRELMMKSGLSGQRVFTLTYGKDRPVALGHDEESMSKNRRGEFILVLPKKIITTQNTQ